MKKSEEETITALQSLFAKVKTLRQINIRDILKPDVYYRYEQTLQEAYDALTTVEDALTSLRAGNNVGVESGGVDAVFREMPVILLLPLFLTHEELPERHYLLSFSRSRARIPHL